MCAESTLLTSYLKCPLYKAVRPGWVTSSLALTKLNACVQSFFVSLDGQQSSGSGQHMTGNGRAESILLGRATRTNSEKVIVRKCNDVRR